MAYVFYHGKDNVSMVLMAIAFVASCVFGINVAVVVLAAAAIGLIRMLLVYRKVVRK